MRLNAIDEFVVLDLEATCWPESPEPRKQETIEIGAVRYRPDAGIVDEIDVFVRPTENRILSPFCIDLTGITQEQVDAGVLFRAAFTELKRFAGEEPVICSWTDFDREQLLRDCARHRVDYPFVIHIDLAKLFGRRTTRGYLPLRDALASCAMKFEGRQHSGIDDARNLALLLEWLIRKERSFGQTD
jgi:inhibitor of KinA sporulation pathway (predicted exonuclease)